MSKNQIAHDLGQKMQIEIGATLERNIAIAQHVLKPADLSIMLVEAAIGMILTTAATIAASTEDQAGAGEMFDVTIDMMAAVAKGDRTRALAAAAGRRAETGR